VLTPVQTVKTPARARILIASDNAEDARQIARLLKEDFESVRTSTDPEKAVAEFEACKPEVLVLAFDALEKSERYYLGLYRLSAGAIQGAHRTVVLCGKDEVQTAFELCRKDYFDDYVLFWPQSYDGRRLAMSIWIACRQMNSGDLRPGNAELLLHAKHLADLERVVAETGASPGLLERLQPALTGTRPLATAARALRPKVLVVDDDEFSQQLVRQSLDPLRWEVNFAGDGRSALAHLRRVKTDLILMDVRLPGPDGVTLTRRLKASPESASIPIVMMTGDSRREILVDSIEAGAAGFVVKPVTRNTLEAKLDKILPR
jgi:CheY-like chemotaxis protein